MARSDNYLFATNSSVTAGRWIGRVLWMSVKVLAALQLQFLLLVAFSSLLLNWVRPPVTSLMLCRAIVRHDPVKPIRWVSLEEIPEDFQWMIIWLEDRRFYLHHGLDFLAIQNAMEENRAAGRSVAGGSTITQQLARTLFLIPAKSYLRKGLEAEIALEMEHFMSKQRILELYINTIEWGPGVFGFGNASYYHYGTPPSSLSRQQMIKLAAIIASPLRYDTSNFYHRSQLLYRYSYLVGMVINGNGSRNDEIGQETLSGTEIKDPMPSGRDFIEQVLRNCGGVRKVPPPSEGEDRSVLAPEPDTHFGSLQSALQDRHTGGRTDRNVRRGNADSFGVLTKPAPSRVGSPDNFRGKQL